jgi:hypothetical protein
MDAGFFHKIDEAEDVTDTSVNAFQSRSSIRSDPRVTADVIYEAVTDNKPGKVRYYSSGPDGIAIPRVKQLLGQEWYWQEFRGAVLGKPSPLWQALVPAPIAADKSQQGHVALMPAVAGRARLLKRPGPTTVRAIHCCRTPLPSLDPQRDCARTPGTRAISA